MNPGTLREKITVEKPTEARNALGEATQTWAVFSSRFASVRSANATQRMSADQQGMAITHNVKMRHLGGLKSNYRIKWRNRTLHIVSILEHENLTVHELLCEEKT